MLDGSEKQRTWLNTAVVLEKKSGNLTDHKGTWSHDVAYGVWFHVAATRKCMFFPDFFALKKARVFMVCGDHLCIQKFWCQPAAVHRILYRYRLVAFEYIMDHRSRNREILTPIVSLRGVNC